MSSSTTRIRPKNAAIVGLGWWGQHILRQMSGSNVVRMVYAVGSREEHRAHADNCGTSHTRLPAAPDGPPARCRNSHPDSDRLW